MTVGNIAAMPNNICNTVSSYKNSASSKFVIPEIDEQLSSSDKIENGSTVDPISAMESMTGKSAVNAPSYKVTEEEAEYFCEKYGKEFDEENPYQLFYELEDKNIISSDDAARASGYSRIFSSYSTYTQKSSAWKENYSDFNCYDIYYKRFMSSYEKEINSWLDIVQREHDFWQYLIDLDEELVTPDGTYFQSSKEQMNVGFRRECEEILKVKDVLSQIFE